MCLNQIGVSLLYIGSCEKLRRRVIATSTGQRANLYWSPIGSSTGHRAK